MKDYLGPNEIPLVDPEFTREEQWNNAIRRYGVKNAHIWFGIEDLSEIQMTRDVLLGRSGIVIEDSKE